ncbi:MAG: hypothetical protein JF599_03535 [Verrucomicrobia bacterium]|nr:hypothetical protein [Verrucomicrobiota bacterium]
MSDTAAATPHVWKFFRIGGLDQVAIETGADLLALKDLDQKLWVALSCPVKGLELDEKTLALIDSNKDGRIRVPELLDAIQWAALHLQDVGLLLKGSDSLPLSAFNVATPEGKAALTSARRILASLGKSDAVEISLAEAIDTVRLFATTRFNGDGIITPDSAAPDESLKRLIADIAATLGGVTDRSGGTGIDQGRIDSFYAEATAFATWSDQGASPAVLAFGANTPAAFAAVQAVRAKIDDYFSRTRLAAYDARALAALNRSETDYLDLAAKDLTITSAEIAGFPLARIAASQPLPLAEDAVNPAWASALATLRNDALAPIFGPDKTSLSESEWTSLKARLAAYENWAALKAGAVVAPLGLERIKAVLAADQKAALTALVAQDKALDPEFTAIASVEKLLRFARDFRTLLNNFVNFFDFYSPSKLATFQAGTLYLDSRSTEFCIGVEAPHPLAAMSKAYIAYVDCKRPGGQVMKVAACFTQGDSDYLFVGRNGLFYDRLGQDWDATITSIADNPISIRQAFFSPYKKFIRMVEEQVAKRAAAADAETTTKLSGAAAATANVDKGIKVAEPKKIDIGTVAALGVAVGAIGGALGAVATGLAKLSLYQVPLVPLGVIAVISGPSMLIAWLKLRQRNIGPLLEANGWAINGRVKINIPFGTQLTERARLPANAERSLKDPYEDKVAARRRKLTLTLILVLAAAAIYTRWDHNQHGYYFWASDETKAAVAKKKAEAAKAAAEAATALTTPPPAAPAR